GANPVEKVTLLAELFIAVFLVAVDVVWPVGVWAWRRIQLRRTFELRVLATKLAASVNQNVPIAIDVALGQTTEINRFNLRFVRGRTGGNVSPETISINSVVERNEVPLAFMKDGEGGCDCWWFKSELPRKVYSGKAVQLIVNAQARTEWSGYLSFHGYDA